MLYNTSTASYNITLELFSQIQLLNESSCYLLDASWKYMKYIANPRFYILKRGRYSQIQVNNFYNLYVISM